MIVIDRFEGEFVVAYDDEIRFEIPRVLLSETTAKEGDVLIKDGEIYRVDSAMTAKRRAEMLEKIKKLT